MNKLYAFMVFLIAMVVFSACATAPKEKAREPIKKAIPVEEQRTLAMKKFNDILLLSRSTRDKKVLLPKMEQQYLELVNDYPDAPIAQESYFKLIEIYVNKQVPPQYDKAEKLYIQYASLYPESPFKNLVDRTLGVRYYKDKEWGRLLRMTTPVFDSYVKKGKRPPPFMIFSYAESNFQLRRFDEAEKGFNILLEKFPDFSDNKLAKARITYIQRKK